MPLAPLARVEVHHQRGREEQADADHVLPVLRQECMFLQMSQPGRPEMPGLHVQQRLPHRARVPVGVEMQAAVLEPHRRLKLRRSAVRVIEPERMRKDVVEGRFHLGQERGHRITREGRIEEGQTVGILPAHIPDIGVMGVAMGDNPARIGKGTGRIAAVGQIEHLAKAAHMFNAVDDGARRAHLVPGQPQVAGKGEAPPVVEPVQPAARIAAGAGIEKPFMKQPVDRLGGGLPGRDRMQAVDGTGKDAVVQPGLGGHGTGDGLGIIQPVKRKQDIREARIGAAVVDQHLLPRQGRDMDRRIDRQPGLREDARAVIFPAHLLLALLLMELEEELAVTRTEEPVERIERILIDVDLQPRHRDAEQPGDELLKHRLGARGVAGRDRADFGGARGCGFHVSRPCSG